MYNVLFVGGSKNGHRATVPELPQCIEFPTREMFPVSAKQPQSPPVESLQQRIARRSVTSPPPPVKLYPTPSVVLRNLVSQEGVVYADGNVLRTS